MTSDPWGADAVERVMRDLRPVLPPPAHQSPLEYEVVGLQEMALGSSRDEPAMSDSLNEAWFANVSLVVVDAVVARDMRALDALEKLISEVYRVVLTAQDDATDGDADPYSADLLQSCAHWAELTADYVRSAQSRVAPAAAAISLKGSRQERFLSVVAEQPGINSRRIGSVINADQTSGTAAGRAPKPMDEGQLSRIGHGLRTEGYVFAERTARGLSWDLTPRGRDVLDQLSRTSKPVELLSHSMLITTSRVAPVEVAKQIIADKPSSLIFVRSNNTIKYQCIDHSDYADAHAPRIDFVVKDLLDDDSRVLPSHFSIGDERLCYAQSADIPADIGLRDRTDVHHA
jgi:hypothetical protein